MKKGTAHQIHEQPAAERKRLQSSVKDNLRDKIVKSRKHQLHVSKTSEPASVSSPCDLREEETKTSGGVSKDANRNNSNNNNKRLNSRNVVLEYAALKVVLQTVTLKVV